MPAKATAINVTYYAWDTGTGGQKTGDVTNHTCQFSQDGGTPYTLSASPSEVGSGVYKIDLSATDTNCDFGTLIVTSTTSGVVIPAIGIVFNEAVTAQQNASAVWSFSPARSLTVSPTDISSLATASAVSALQTSVDAIPTTSAPTASANASAVWGAAARTLTASPTDISSLATASAVAEVKTAVEAISVTAPTAAENATAVWGATTRTLTASPTDTSSLATAASITALATVLNKVFALVGRWKVVGNVLTAYDTDGTAIGTWDLTRDVNKFITEVKPSTTSTTT